MSILSLALFLAVAAVDVDVVTVPLSSDVKITLTPGARAELRREDTVTRIRVDIDRMAVPSTLGPAFNTYVVWAISPEGILDNLGEVDVKGVKGQFSATTRLTQFGVLITAEPHYMVDQPSSAVAYRSQGLESDFRRKTVPIDVGAYDYSQIKPTTAVGVNNSVAQARTAFQIAQTLGAERLAPVDYRNAEVALGALDVLVKRAAPIDIMWPAANEAIRLSQRAVISARAKR